MPVPWSSVPPPFTSMETTEGWTRSISLGMLAPLGRIAPPGVAEFELMVTSFEFDADFEAKWPARPPTRAATSKSETRVDQGERLGRDWDDSGAGSGSGPGTGALTGAGYSGSE